MTHIGNAAASGLTWRKSSYSGGQSDCVEVAHGVTSAMPVRDSKNPAGPAIVIRDTAWGAFIDAVVTDTLA
ncbi:MULTISPECIES: DUF397 domain-containing protein [unclassified Streptomyces]|uniref:DUF397 domain-containing protein n=1 Tax=unclassified Streptomyces TaxID=2593676 RepID=UPI0032557D81